MYRYVDVLLFLCFWAEFDAKGGNAKIFMNGVSKRRIYDLLFIYRFYKERKIDD